MCEWISQYTLTTPGRLKVRARNRVLATRGIPRINPDLLIIDDADLCSDASTNRAQFCARLIGSATFTLWVAATDANDPMALSYLTPLLAHLTDSKRSELKNFRSWCRSRGFVSGDCSVETNDGDPADSSAPAQLAELLFEGDPCAAIRRTPTMEFQAVQADDDDFERPQMVAEPESRQQMLSRFLSAADRADLPSDSSHDGELPDWERQIIERMRRWHSAAPDGTRQRTGAGTMLFRRMSLSSLMQISDTGEIRLNSLDADSYAVSVGKPDRLDMATEDVILRLCWHGPVAALPMDVARLQAGTLYIDMRDELQPGQRRLGYL